LRVWNLGEEVQDEQICFNIWGLGFRV